MLITLAAASLAKFGNVGLPNTRPLLNLEGLIKCAGALIVHLVHARNTRMTMVKAGSNHARKNVMTGGLAL